MASGDRVGAENYFQHAEHYHRIVNANVQANAQANNNQPNDARANNGQGNDGQTNSGRGHDARANGEVVAEVPAESGGKEAPNGQINGGPMDKRVPSAARTITPEQSGPTTFEVADSAASESLPDQPTAKPADEAEASTKTNGKIAEDDSAPASS